MASMGRVRRSARQGNDGSGTGSRVAYTVEVPVGECAYLGLGQLDGIQSRAGRVVEVPVVVVEVEDPGVFASAFELVSRLQVFADTWEINGRGKYFA